MGGLQDSSCNVLSAEQVKFILSTVAEFNLKKGVDMSNDKKPNKSNDNKSNECEFCGGDGEVDIFELDSKGNEITTSVPCSHC